MSENILQAIIGALEGSQKGVDMVLQDHLARRRNREQLDLQKQVQMDLMREKAPYELEQKQKESQMALDNSMTLAKFQAGLPTKSNPDDYVSGADIMAFAPTLAGKLDPAKKYSKSLLPVIQNQMEANKKQQDLEAKLEVPGFERMGNVMPDVNEAEKMRQFRAEYLSFKKQLDDYKAMIEKHGTTELFGEVQGQMESLANGLQLTLKNIDQLGVLSSSDIKFLEGQIPQPGFWQSESGMRGKLDQSSKKATEKFISKMESSGYKPTKDFLPYLSNEAGGGNGWSDADEARLQELKRKAAQK